MVDHLKVSDPALVAVLSCAGLPGSLATPSRYTFATFEGAIDKDCSCPPLPSFCIPTLDLLVAITLVTLAMLFRMKLAMPLLHDEVL